VKAYLKGVFDERFDPEDFDQALQKRREFLISLKRCFSPLRRLLGFLNPANLLSRRI
jgi:hypothetical protein